MSKKIFLLEKTMSVNASNSKQEENQPEKMAIFQKMDYCVGFFQHSFQHSSSIPPKIVRF